MLNKEQLLSEIYAIGERLKEVSLLLDDAEQECDKKEVERLRNELNEFTRYLWSEVWKLERR